MSVRMQLISNIRRICDVPPSSFNPPPKVFSSLVVFAPLRPEMRLDIKLEKYLDKLLRISFNSRPQDISINKWIKLADDCIKIKDKNQ